MVKVLDEHERTMAFAEVALGQIRSLRQTAVPRNYEIWYVYATGYNAPLNKVINETLARNGRLTEADLEQIYETYLSHIKTTDRIDKVGARVIGEIDDVMKLITEALGMSESYDTSLADASEKLATARTSAVWPEAENPPWAPSSKMRTVASTLALTRKWPSLLKATLLIQLVWPR